MQPIDETRGGSKRAFPINQLRKTRFLRRTIYKPERAWKRQNEPIHFHPKGTFPQSLWKLPLEMFKMENWWGNSPFTVRRGPKLAFWGPRAWKIQVLWLLWNLAVLGKLSLILQHGEEEEAVHSPVPRWAPLQSHLWSIQRHTGGAAAPPWGVHRTLRRPMWYQNPAIVEFFKNKQAKPSQYCSF